MHDMVNRAEFEHLLAQLGGSIQRPEDEALEDQWADLMWCDAVLAGSLSTALHGGRVPPAEVDAALRAIAAHPEWTVHWSEQVELLERAGRLLRAARNGGRGV